MKCFVRLSFLCLLFALPQASEAMSRQILHNVMYRSRVEGLELFLNPLMTNIVCQREIATGEISCYKMLDSGKQVPMNKAHFAQFEKMWRETGQFEVTLNEAPAEQIESSEIKKA